MAYLANPGRGQRLPSALGGAGLGGHGPATEMDARVREGPVALPRGTCFGLSNGLLGEWRKVHAGVRELTAAMATAPAALGARGSGGDGNNSGSRAQAIPWDALFDCVLGDSCKTTADTGACSADPSDPDWIYDSRFIPEVDVPQVWAPRWTYRGYERLLGRWHAWCAYRGRTACVRPTRRCTR
mmetsp:Transcript_14970/g.44060  ORF Transcript_14970/g.44060 Transcript_14970/m.44060 type:complete len:184 (-) Transcript_14970:200-751(-)